MAGPTPVSALIHAATMVTAGVYMVCRLFFLFDLAPDAAQDVVAWVGGLTAVFAATIGLAQNDIKKVLAYSTVSQLGYMFLAAGLGAYGAAIFHVVTHAFFKACLFLGSGAVIHALHGEQDMRKMGGLKKELPAVFWHLRASPRWPRRRRAPLRLLLEGRHPRPTPSWRSSPRCGRWACWAPA
jgi:NADH-quinone oxidoreductase subunit L